MLAAELPNLPEQVALEVRDHFADLGNWLKSVFRDLGADEIGAGDAAEDFVATVHGAMLSARAAGRPELFKRIARHALARVTR